MSERGEEGFHLLTPGELLEVVQHFFCHSGVSGHILVYGMLAGSHLPDRGSQLFSGNIPGNISGGASLDGLKELLIIRLGSQDDCGNAGQRPFMILASYSPLREGASISMSTTSGGEISMVGSTSLPTLASPQTSISGIEDSD